MASSQAIPNIRLTGTHVFSLVDSQPGDTDALLVIDRTVSGGLNSLTSADTLTISVERSLDGVTWQQAGGITCRGGVIVTKGHTLTQDTLDVGLEAVGERFRITTVASTPVRIAGTVFYS
jgi:hypothetical protein